MNKNCNSISDTLFIFIVENKSLFQMLILKQCIFIYLYCRFSKFSYTIKITISFSPTEQDIFTLAQMIFTSQLITPWSRLKPVEEQ